MTELQAQAIIDLMTQNNELLKHIYALSLLLVGSLSALLVVLLLYKFTRLFF